MSVIVARPKVVVMGDAAVGKTALTQMFHSGGQRFPKVYNMTCGVEYSLKAVTLPGLEEAVELHLFDTAGQDVFSDMMPAYWADAQAVVLVYDVTRGHTLHACQEWYHRLCQSIGQRSLPGVVVANKVDLRERLVVPRQDGQQLAASLQMPYCEASALDGTDVETPFLELAKLIHRGPTM